MGDRSNIKIYQPTGSDPIYLYSHSRGSDLYGVLKRALARRERWDDASYLTRIIFCEMVKGDVQGTTGYGISSYLGGNEHTILAVDCAAQRITFEQEDGYAKSSVTFEQFVSRKDKWSVEEQEVA